MSERDYSSGPSKNEVIDKMKTPSVVELMIPYEASLIDIHRRLNEAIASSDTFTSLYCTIKELK